MFSQGKCNTWHLALTDAGSQIKAEWAGAFAALVNKSTSVVGMNSPCESRPSQKVVPSHLTSPVFLAYLICCPLLGNKQPKENRLRGKQTGKESGEASLCSLIMFSCLIRGNELLWEMNNYQRRFLAGDREESPGAEQGQALDAACTLNSGIRACTIFLLKC